MRQNLLAAARIGRLRISSGYQNASQRRVAVLKRREVGRHAEVVILAPTVVWMMVALGAFDPHAQKHLRQRAGRLPRLGSRAEELTLRILGQRPGRRNDLAGEL